MDLTLNTHRAMDTAQGSSKNQRLGRWLDGESTIESLSLDPHHSRKTPVMDRCNLECVCVGGVMDKFIDA